MNKKIVSQIKSANNLTIHKLNVAAYARVSTKKELQESSFELQVATYYEQIVSNPLWNFSGVFADYGKSGTSTAKRKEFNDMIALAMLGEIDIIITKSVSRFTRDVLDGLKIINDLRTLNVEVYFEKENISSLDSSFDLFLSIYTSVAEEESKQISSNVLWNYKKKMEGGLSTTSRLYGFKIIKGEYYINEKEAEAVRLIYKLYLSGYKYSEIIDELENAGYESRNGKKRFSKSGISGILRNEKYAGDMLLQKTTVKKIGTRMSVPNTTKDKYYVYDHHDPIIDKETFKDVQQLISFRSKKYNPAKSKKKPMKYSNYVYSIIADKFYKSKVNHRGTKYEVKLLEVLDNNGNRILEAKNIYYRQIDELLEVASKQLISKQASIKKDIIEIMNTKINASNIDYKIESNMNASKDLKAKRGEITGLNLDSSLTNELTIKIENELKDLKFERSKLMFEKVMVYDYSKKYSVLKKMLLDVSRTDDFDFKELFKMVIAVDRENLILPLHLSNRNIKDVIISDEITSPPLFTGTFEFKQTRLNLDIKWSIIIF